MRRIHLLERDIYNHEKKIESLEEQVSNLHKEKERSEFFRFTVTVYVGIAAFLAGCGFMKFFN